MIDLKELSLVSGKAAWMTYLVSFYIDLRLPGFVYQPQKVTVAWVLWGCLGPTMNKM